MKIKRAFSTVACLDLSANEILLAAKKAGIDTIEVRLGRNGNFMGYTDEKLSEAKAALDTADIKVSDIGTSVGFRSYDEGRIAAFKRCIDIAAAVGARGLRLFLGNGVKYRTDRPLHDYDGIVRAIRESCDYAKGLGVEVWAETHNEFSKGSVLSELIKAVDRDNFKIIWDLIHPYELGESAEETIAALGDRIAHVHIKDGVKNPDRNILDYTYTKLGEGQLPVEHMLRALHATGYDGYCSLEWENEWRKEIKTVYSSLDEILRDFNRYVDKIEGNLLPEITTDAWVTYVPDFKKIVKFSKDLRAVTLDMQIASNAYATGKWLCDAEVVPGKTYDFSVGLDTDAVTNEVYVMYTVMGAKGGYALREHAKNNVRCGEHLFFHDKFTVPECDAEKLTVRIELWLKGYYSYVKYRQPTLSLGVPYPERKATVAIAYMKLKAGPFSLERNANELLAIIDECAKSNPDIIITGEGMYHSCVGGNVASHAESVDGPMCMRVRSKAKELGCYIVYNFHEKDGAEYYNTSILIGRSGEVVGRYRKTHLTVGELEKGLTPGDSYPVFDTDFGKVGMLICWDHYFSDPMEQLVKNGAELVCVSSAGDAEAKCIARAMDGAVHLAVCGWNVNNDYNWGPGRIVDPSGKILADTWENGVPAVATIDFSKKISRGYLSTGAAKSEYYSVYKYNRHEMEF